MDSNNKTEAPIDNREEPSSSGRDAGLPLPPYHPVSLAQLQARAYYYRRMDRLQDQKRLMQQQHQPSVTPEAANSQSRREALCAILEDALSHAIDLELSQAGDGNDSSNDNNVPSNSSP